MNVLKNFSHNAFFDFLLKKRTHFYPFVLSLHRKSQLDAVSTKLRASSDLPPTDFLVIYCLTLKM